MQQLTGGETFDAPPVTANGMPEPSGGSGGEAGAPGKSGAHFYHDPHAGGPPTALAARHPAIAASHKAPDMYATAPAPWAGAQ